MSITPQQLLESALTRHRGVLSCDIVFGDDAGASVGHDDREAPFVPDDGDGEEPGFLISITDEDPERLCAVVRVAEDSDVLGVGIDLASTEDWTQDERGERFAELLFTEHEKALISAADGSVPLLRAKGFSAKEAAFKLWDEPGTTLYEDIRLSNDGPTHLIATHTKAPHLKARVSIFPLKEAAFALATHY